MILKVSAKWTRTLIDPGARYGEDFDVARQTSWIAFDAGAVVYAPIRVDRIVIGVDLATSFPPLPR